MRVIERRGRIMHGTWTDDHQQAVILAVQAGANLVTRIGDDLLRLFAQRQIAQHLRRRGQHFEFQYATVHDAADADLVLPARHVGFDQRVPTLIHRPPDGAKIFRRIQLLHGTRFPRFAIFPKDSNLRQQRKTSRRPTTAQRTAANDRGESADGRRAAGHRYMPVSGRDGQ